MKKRFPLLIREIGYSLRGGFLVRPLTIAVALGCLGALLSWAEQIVPAMGSWLPGFLSAARADPQVAQNILGAVAGSIMTVVSIVFAILLMTLTLASMQFSPRIIVSFTRDRVTQWTLGIFLGTFLYCVAALPAAHFMPQPFSPAVTVAGAILLAIVCVALLLFFIHHISRAISVNHIVDRIASETEAVIDEIMPRPLSNSPLRGGRAVDVSAWESAVCSDASGYIRFIDTRRLLFLATSCRLKVHVIRRVGQFVPEGIPLLLVHKKDRLTEELSAGFRSAFDCGPARTLLQDVEFGVLQIVDIALKAISPAVNDPTTAISCVDQLSRILIRFSSREPAAGLLYDPAGTARVSIPWISFEKLLDSAFEQIRMYSKADMAVSLRLLRGLGDIASATADAGARQMLVERGKRVVEGCAGRLAADEMRPVRARLAALEAFAAHTST